MKLIYPALFHLEDGAYWAQFPDLEGCQTFGDTLEDTFTNAKEALNAYCATIIGQQKKLAPPSKVDTLQHCENAILALIEVDINLCDKSIKKTLTIPSWLNDYATANNANFSQVLQDALISELCINRP